MSDQFSERVWDTYVDFIVKLRESVLGDQRGDKAPEIAQVAATLTLAVWTAKSAGHGQLKDLD